MKDSSEEKQKKLIENQEIIKSNKLLHMIRPKLTPGGLATLNYQSSLITNLNRREKSQPRIDLAPNEEPIVADSKICKSDPLIFLLTFQNFHFLSQQNTKQLTSSPGSKIPDP